MCTMSHADISFDINPIQTVTTIYLLETTAATINTPANAPSIPTTIYSAYSSNLIVTAGIPACAKLIVAVWKE